MRYRKMIVALHQLRRSSEGEKFRHCSGKRQSFSTVWSVIRAHHSDSLPCGFFTRDNRNCYNAS